MHIYNIHTYIWYNTSLLKMLPGNWRSVLLKACICVVPNICRSFFFFCFVAWISLILCRSPLIFGPSSVIKRLRLPSPVGNLSEFRAVAEWKRLPHFRSLLIYRSLRDAILRRSLASSVPSSSSGPILLFTLKSPRRGLFDFYAQNHRERFSDFFFCNFVFNPRGHGILFFIFFLFDFDSDLGFRVGPESGGSPPQIFAALQRDSAVRLPSNWQ